MFHAPRSDGGGLSNHVEQHSSVPSSLLSSSFSASAPEGGAGAAAASDTGTSAGSNGSDDFPMQTGDWTGDSVARVEFMSVPPAPLQGDAMDDSDMMDGDTDDDATGIP